MIESLKTIYCMQTINTRTTTDKETKKSQQQLHPYEWKFFKINIIKQNKKQVLFSILIKKYLSFIGTVVAELNSYLAMAQNLNLLIEQLCLLTYSTWNVSKLFKNV